MIVRVKVQIGTLTFNSVHSVRCKKSIKAFTGTAQIKLPKKLRFRSNGRPDSMYEPTKTVKDYIKVGDEVTIWMGYDQHLIKRFEGYVSRGLEPSVPVVIECEDEMWKLKRKEVSVSLRKTSIKEIINTIAPEYDADVLDADIGNFSMKNTTATKVLQELKKRYGLRSYFIGKTLIVGKPYTNKVVSDLALKTYDFSHNVIKSSLKFRSVEDNKIKVNAISINPDNTKVKVTVGDPEGATRTLHYFDKKKADMIKLATIDLEKFKIEGYEGKLTSFGFPIVEVGQRVQIVDKSYDKRNSEHYVDEYEEWIDNGYRREPTISRKVM